MRRTKFFTGIVSALLLADVAGVQPGVGKAIYMDFGRVGSPYVNVSF